MTDYSSWTDEQVNEEIAIKKGWKRYTNHDEDGLWDKWYTEEQGGEIEGHCTYKNCFMYGHSFLFIDLKKFNTRPIEEALRAELACRDEIISRLKEDAEKMYNWALDHYAQNECENAKFDHEIGVDLNSHRALMKELEEK